MKPPQVPDEPVEVSAAETLSKLLKAYEGTDFMPRREMAMLLLFIDTGMRRTELASLKLSDIELDQRIVRLKGKGNGKGPRIRLCPIERKTTKTLDRYFHIRATNQNADCKDKGFDCAEMSSYAGLAVTRTSVK